MMVAFNMVAVLSAMPGDPNTKATDQHSAYSITKLVGAVPKLTKDNSSVAKSTKIIDHLKLIDGHRPSKTRYHSPNARNNRRRTQTNKNTSRRNHKIQ